MHIGILCDAASECVSSTHCTSSKVQRSFGACADCALHAGIPPRRSKDYVKQPSPRNSQTGNPVYRVRTYSTSNAELDNSQPLTGKQPGVLNVEAPSAVRLSSADPDALP